MLYPLSYERATSLLYLDDLRGFTRHITIVVRVDFVNPIFKMLFKNEFRNFGIMKPGNFADDYDAP